MNHDSRLVTTRRSLHGVAELVLAGPQHAQTGEISLRSRAGRLRDDAHSRPAASSAPRCSAGTARSASTATPRRRWPSALGRRGDVAVRGLHRRLGRRSRRPARGRRRGGRHDRRRVRGRRRGAAVLAPDETPILWPEHFDIGISVGEVNYGVSAGDGYLAVPYAYVGPWSPPARTTSGTRPSAAPSRSTRSPTCSRSSPRAAPRIAGGLTPTDVIRAGRHGDQFV